ncbi:hypothetical protein BJX76DRAFT_196699 [Aspergillus varians]
MYLTASFGMPLRWRKRPQRPPGPFVEDEIDSLSRELNGSSRVGEPSGFEGAKARGTVNQYPLILDIEILDTSNTSSDAEEKPSPGYRSSGFNASQSTSELDSKPEPKDNPLRQPAGESQSQGLGKPRPRSPSKSQDIPPMSHSPMPAHTQVPDLRNSSPGTSQESIPRQPEPAPWTPSASGDVLPPKLPSKPIPDVAQKSQTAPSRTPSLRRGQKQHNAASPTRYAQPEAVRNSGVRTSSPAKSTPEVAEKDQSVPSRSSSLRRRQEQYKSNSSTRYTASEPLGNPRTSSPPKRIPDVEQKPQTVPSRYPQESQNMSLPTAPHHPGPIRDTSVWGPALPPKQMSDATRQSQPTVPRPLPTPPDDGPRKSHPPSVSYLPEIIVRESGVRIERIPPRSMPDMPQTIQRPLPEASENVQYNSFPSSIPPPRSSPDTPPKTQALPLHPLPNPPAEGTRMPPSSTVKRSGSVKQAKPSTAELRPSRSGYASDSASIRHDHASRPSNHNSSLPTERNSSPSNGLSVAERLEEKLKIRRQQRESGDISQNTAAQADSQPPGSWPSDMPSEPSSNGLTQFPILAQSTEEAKPQAKAAPLKSALRSQSLDRTQPASTKVTRRRTVAFAEKPLEFPSQALVKVDHETALAQIQSQEDGSPDSSRSSSPNTGLTLSPCPRSIPIAGYQDWHTIEGLNHLDICPSCIKQMRKTKFRDRLTLSTPKPRTEPINCAMSEPWTRLAWMQTLKKKLEGLDLLLEVTRPSQGTKTCTGRIVNDQHWYRVVDPETGSYLPQFNVCSACVRNIRLLMPEHRETFERSSTPRERVCDFVTDSPRFIRYIDALDLAAKRAEQEDARPYLKEFLAYARRKVVLRDCRRSRLILNTWHYMPQLPEFTVCEDCYDDIVWPLVKARHPIARDFSSIMRLLPGDTGSGDREASCQLYSPRIRAKFNDAVRRDDMPFIKWMASTRYEAERRFRDRQDKLLDDQRHGYNCSEDLRKNLEDWKRYE